MGDSEKKKKIIKNLLKIMTGILLAIVLAQELPPVIAGTRRFVIIPLS